MLLIAFTGLTWAADPPSVIVDTDMLTDCDDAGALAMLHALADAGEVKILGFVLNGQDTHGKHSVVVAAINRHYGRASLPIGVCKRPAGTTPRKASSYSRAIFEEFPHDGLIDEQRPDALRVYRQLLAAAPDHSVTIASIGFLTNLDSLLRSPGDAIDARDGLALVQDKVRLLSLMGGKYPSGKEYNLSFGGSADAARYVNEHWPDATVPMVFGGFELGGAVITGKVYVDAPQSPMRRCYEIAYESLKKGRPSWDQLTILHAVRGRVHHDVTYWTEVVGSNLVAADGTNTWQAVPQRRQVYLVRALDNAAMATLVDGLMIRPPTLPGR
ncbi:MAG: nucleoside hydrolase [Planctomycetes bacterium]|nr:nucleoside hydrolase [Planctomycetota bacterium]